MELYILFIFVFIIDCVFTYKLTKSKVDELELLREEKEILLDISHMAADQRDILFHEIKKFNDNAQKFNDKFNDDGK